MSRSPKLEGTVRTPVDATIDVPPGKDLAVWFHASDAGGCSQWDSAYERNYHFALAEGDRTFRFNADWSTSTFGSGDSLLLAYDPVRLWQCRATYNGLAAWDVVAHYRFDGGPEQFASLTAPENGSRVAIPARITRPSGARHLEVWFENHDRTGCHAWDSRYGANYHFDL